MLGGAGAGPRARGAGVEGGKAEGGWRWWWRRCRGAKECRSCRCWALGLLRRLERRRGCGEQGRQGRVRVKTRLVGALCYMYMVHVCVDAALGWRQRHAVRRRALFCFACARRQGSAAASRARASSSLSSASLALDPGASHRAVHAATAAAAAAAAAATTTLARLGTAGPGALLASVCYRLLPVAVLVATGTGTPPGACSAACCWARAT